jgi:RimJ/RimL family protein N-acetyltransferase
MLICELPSGSFGVAAPLFRSAWFDRALIDAVFEGRQPGRIFVDDLQQPRASLLCRTYDYYVAGDPGTVVLRRFMEEAPAETGVFETLYGYVPVDEAWVRAMVEDSGGRLDVIPRRGFTLTGVPGASTESRSRLLAGDAVVMPIDRDLAERIDTELGEHIGFFWAGYENFAGGGFGYCATLGGRLASVAYTVAVSSRHANIVVATVEAFRRRGLATLVCAAFIEQCKARRVTLEWDSDASNAASVALARRLGCREGPPFSELSPPGRSKMALSRGFWTKQGQPVGTSPAATVWCRRD